MGKKLKSIIKWDSIPYLIEIGHPKHKQKFFKNKAYHFDLAQYGTDEDRDKLILNKNPKVRLVAIQYGNEKHIEMGLKDSDKAVRNEARHLSGDVYEP